MSAYLSRIALATIACVLAAPASSQTVARKDLSIDGAVIIATTAMADCKAKGWPVSATVVGRNGEVLVQLRGDGTGPHTMQNSYLKAFTSRTFRIPSGDLQTRLKGDPTLGLIHLSNVIANQGALPIKIGEETIGAIGASGAPGGEKDEVCVKAGIDQVAGMLK